MYYNYLMIDLDVPGCGKLQFDHLVCDVNGTLAFDGELIAGVADRIKTISSLLKIHLVTANTHGKQDIIDRELGTNAVILQAGDEAVQKADYVEKLDSRKVIAIGQGANDRLMLKKAGLGICVLSCEGSFMQTVLAADILVPDILNAFDLITHPKRLVATLRQ